MHSYKLTKKALSDLMDIGRFTDREWGKEQRNIYLKQLDDCFSQLSDNPMQGLPCDYISKDYRKFPQGSHIIFYKNNSDDEVEIIRILHKSMDVKSKL